MTKPKIVCESNKNDEIFSKIVQDSKETEIKLPILGIKKRKHNYRSSIQFKDYKNYEISRSSKFGN